MGLRDWFGNNKDGARKTGPHTGTGGSGTMGIGKIKPVFRTSDGKKVQPSKKKK